LRWTSFGKNNPKKIRDNKLEYKKRGRKPPLPFAVFSTDYIRNKQIAVELGLGDAQRSIEKI
jgi:hypothetical protein